MKKEGARFVETCKALQVASLGRSCLQVQRSASWALRRRVEFGSDFNWKMDSQMPHIPFTIRRSFETMAFLILVVASCVSGGSEPSVAQEVQPDSPGWPRWRGPDWNGIAPQAIYAALSGFGTTGPDAGRQAFDQTAFWARSGAMSVFGDRDDPGPLLWDGAHLWVVTESYDLVDAEPDRELAFPASEFARRLDRIRREMSDNDIDCLFVTSPESMYYLSGFMCMWYQTESPMEWPPSNGFAVHVNGVLSSREATGLLDFLDIERVEIAVAKMQASIDQLRMSGK